MSTPDQMPARIARILNRLTEQTNANKIKWERGAPFDSYATDVATVRFRIRSASGNGEPPYVLEFLRDAAHNMPIVTGDTIDTEQAQAIQNLYNAARSNAVANSPDPFDAVEKELGTTPAPSANE
jgi:hypothetical protein